MEYNLALVHKNINKKPAFSATMLILMLVMVINALSYGIIIPLLYPFAAKFGINPFGLSLLIATYSLFQFLATPFIGRMSDKYGRKPLLVICLLGSSAALALFASAQSLIQLVVARMLDGITGGNNSVAQAVIADTHKPQDRSKAFGMLGAAFGVGFLLGPGLGGLLSQYSLTLPFWVASGFSLLAAILAMFLLPETLDKNVTVAHAKPKLFDFPKLWHALWAPTTGVLLMITLLASIGQNAFILGFQSVTVDVLNFSPTQIGIIFTAFGLVNVLMQGLGIRYLLKIAHSRDLLLFSLGMGVILVGILGFAQSATVFLVLLVIYMFIPPAAPFLTGLISSATAEADQGGMLGLSQAYTSIGMVIGPLLAGLVAQWYAPGAFWLASGVWLVAVILTQRVSRISKLAKV